MLEERIQAAQAMILEEKREKSMKRGQVYYQITLSLDVTYSWHDHYESSTPALFTTSPINRLGRNSGVHFTTVGRIVRQH